MNNSASPCDRCGNPGHGVNRCKVPNDPTMTSLTLWTSLSSDLTTRRSEENRWIGQMQHMRARFDQYFWNQPIVQDALPRMNLPGTTPATTATVTHDEEAAFAPKLRLRRDDKINDLNPHRYHPIRPGFSAKSPEDVVMTNHFPVTLPARIWVYDISGFPSPITRQRKKVLAETMFNCAPFLDTRVTPSTQASYVYDGNDRIVAWVDLFNLPTAPPPAVDPGSGLREVSVHEVPSARSLNGGNELRTMFVRERVMGGIDLQTFRETNEGLRLTLPGDTSDDVTSLNAIISKAASEVTGDVYGTFPIGTNKFFLKSAYDELGGPRGVLRAHTGFFSTLKPAMGQTVLNLNIATSAFYQPILVSEYLNRVRGTADITNRESQGLRNVRVYINYLRGQTPTDGSLLRDQPINRGNARVRTICGLARTTVNATSFVMNGVNTRLVNYLNNAYSGQTRFFPIRQGGLLAVNLGTVRSPEWYCPEHLKIMPYQPWTGLVPTTYSDSMINSACLNPGPAKAAIMERGRYALGISSAVGNNAILTGSGLAIGDEMMRVQMWQVPAPVLNFRGGLTRRPDEGQWNMQGRVFRTEGGLLRLHFIANSDCNNEFQLSTNGSRLFVGLTEYMGHGTPGPRIQRRTHVLEGTSLTRDAVADLLNRSARDLRSCQQMVVWIHPDGNKRGYVNFRRILDRELGFPSLCITHNKLNRNWGNLAGFAANNAMKMNVRVGGMGVNHLVDLESENLQLASTMIIGADVTHPSGGAAVGTGSIAALVGTIDPSCQVYRGAARPNPSRTEIIQKIPFGNMLGSLVSKWRSANGNTTPRHILYFRDGVSESQYDAVRDVEVNEIYNTLATYFGGAQVKVTAVICTKRHHTRFYNEQSFPNDVRGRGVNQNTKPGEFLRMQLEPLGQSLKLTTLTGTCVDSGITNPVYFDFFLQSHKAIKGTARPAHYFVLKDDNNFNATQLQTLIHKICFTYARSTTSVSYATPVYYADRLCARIRNYFMDYLSNTRTPRTAWAASETTQAEATYNDFKRDWNAPGRLMRDGVRLAGTAAGNPWHNNLDDTTFWI